MEFIKGITFSPFSPKGSLSSKEAKNSLKNLIEGTGANYIVLVPNALQETPQSEEIDFTSDATVSDKELISMINHIHKEGLHVFLKPTVNCKNGTWRAHINFFDEDVCEDDDTKGVIGYKIEKNGEDVISEPISIKAIDIDGEEVENGKEYEELINNATLNAQDCNALYENSDDEEYIEQLSADDVAVLQASNSIGSSYAEKSRTTYFYGKSGFKYASEFNIRYHGLEEGQDASFFLCKELIPGYLNGITGEYATPAGYFVDEKKAEEFDKMFPYKEKKKLPGQLF